MIGVSFPGNTLVHRFPAGGKLGALFFSAGLTYLLQSLFFDLVLFGGVAVLFRIAGAGGRVFLSWARLLIFPVLLLFGFQLLAGSLESAVVAALRVASLIGFALLVGSTTPPSEVLSFLQRFFGPFSRVGLSPARMALSVTLTLRLIPMSIRLYRETREAQRARGGGGNPVLLLSPFLSRSLAVARDLGEAIDARGFSEASSSRRDQRVSDLTSVALFAGVTAFLGLVPPIPLLFLPVPVTLQTLGFMLSGTILGARLGGLSQLLFFCLIVGGFPLLSGGRGGLPVLFGPTGGFLFSWMFAAVTIGGILKVLPRRNLLSLLLANSIGSLVVVYGIGIPWLAISAGLPFDRAALGCLAFVPGDLAKAVLASLLALRVEGLRVSSRVRE